MIIETGAVDFRSSLGVLLKQVQHQHDIIVITKRGKPVAALIDVRLFKQIQRMAARFDGLCARVEAGFAQTSVVEGAAEIEMVCKAERLQLRDLK